MGQEKERKERVWRIYGTYKKIKIVLDEKKIRNLNSVIDFNISGLKAVLKLEIVLRVPGGSVG